MAIDTRDKRASALNGMPWDPPRFVPDSAIGQGDRQDVANVYRGILAQAPVVLSGVSRWYWHVIAASVFGIGVWILWLML